MLDFVEKHKFGIIGTALFHFILLIFTYNTPLTAESYKKKEFEEVEVTFIEHEPTEEELLAELTENDPNEEIKNMTSNANDKRNKSFEDYSNWKKDATDQSVEDYVKNLEQQYLQERKDAGKSFDASKFEDNNTQTDKKEDQPQQQTNATNQYSGAVTASCHVPGRDCSRIKKPSYKCMGSGKVVLNIEVNQKGIVTKAEIDLGQTNTSKSCLLTQSKKYALRSRFSQDFNAPKSVKGTITYNFVSQ